jgi:hypothetical protein
VLPSHRVDRWDRMNRGSHRYSVYGVEVTSAWPLPLPSPLDRTASVAEVDFVEGTDEDFSDVDVPADPERPWFQSHIFPDGSTNIRWSGHYEYRIRADGSRVACRPLNGSDRAVLQHFLFGQALSFALVQQGIEPLHAAVVQVEDVAVAFLGDCTFGKSTLLAAFLQAGHRVLTDDLLVVGRRQGVPVALPGSGRIKLMPDSASAFFGDPAQGRQLNPRTTKRSFPIERSRVQHGGLPLRHVFALQTPEERNGATSIEILPLSRAAMVQELLKNSFNIENLDRARLVRQFSFVTQLVSDLDVSRLRYPAGLHQLPAVRNRILEHVRRGVATDGARERIL